MLNKKINLDLIVPIIFLFLINFLIVLCFYYYLHYAPVIALHAEIASMHERIRELEETLKKLEEAKQIKNLSFFSSFACDGGSSSINPYVKYLCGCACAVVVIIVCAKVWPAPFIAIKNYTYPYILSCFGYSATEILTIRMVSPEGISYDWLITSSFDYVNIAIKFTGAPDEEYISLHIFLDMVQKCAGEATNSPNHYLYNHMIHLVNIADATATATQVLPIV